MIISMRTTIDLTDEAYQLAKAFAHDRRESLGKVVSELIVKGASGSGPVGQVRLVDGWPVINIGRPITMQEVQDFLDEDE